MSAVTFRDDGSRLDILAAGISGDLESFAWTADLTLAGPEAYRACEPGRHLTLSISGLSFVLLVESRTRDLAAGSATWTAQARTLSCLLDAPYAAALTRSWGETTARAAAAELASLAGLSLSWEVVDWTLPAGRLSASSETPAAVLARIAASCGAVVQPDPSGGVRVIYAHPVGVTEYADAPAVMTLSDDADVLVLSETYAAGAGYDAVTVVDNRAAAEAFLAMELDEDRNAGRATFPPGEPCYLRVYHEGDYALSATSGRLEQVARNETETLSATVSFADADEADLDKLVFAVDAVTWWGPDLGTVSPAGGATVAIGAPGFGVASVTYRTRYDVWRVVPDDLGESFPLLLKLTEANA